MTHTTKPPCPRWLIAPLLIAIIAAMPACDRGAQDPVSTDQVSADGQADVTAPAAPAFTAPPMSDEEAVSRAIELAEASLEAIGGREAWDDVPYITWVYFNGRRVTWDRRGNRVRIDLSRVPQGRPSTLVLDLENGTGQAIEFGYERTGADLDRIVEIAKLMWVEDAYWLLMPFQLLDEGVHIKYLGAGSTTEGKPAEVIEVTYDNVGPTPFGKYHVYFDPETNLVSQWDFFNRVEDTDWQYSTIWADWRQYGDILLSRDRGEYQDQRARFTQIAVYDELPDSVFTNLEMPMFFKDLIRAQEAEDAASAGAGDASGGGG